MEENQEQSQKSQLTDGYKIKVEAFKKAIKGSRGFLKNIAEQLGVDRSSVTWFLREKDDGTLQKMIEEEGARINENIEERLYNMAMEGNIQGKEANATFNAIKTILNKTRGYADKQEIKHSTPDDQILKVEFVEANYGEKDSGEQAIDGKTSDQPETQ